MFYFDSQSNTRYYLGKAFTYNDLQYPASSATSETFTSLGFNEVQVSPRPNDRFYVVYGPDDTGAYTTVPRDLDELKTSFINSDKYLAYSLLRGTDWYIIRALEEPITYSVDSAVHDFRVAVRALSDQRCAAIDACTTLQELENLNLPAFPTLPTTVRSY